MQLASLIAAANVPDLPTGHDLQTDISCASFTLLYFPLLHALHSKSLVSSEYLPGWQILHADNPMISPARPNPHSSHFELPESLDEKPNGHDVHNEPYVPVGHTEQENPNGETAGAMQA